MKLYSPTTPSQRHLVLINKSFLSNNKIKLLLQGKMLNSGGRNSYGRITVFQRGGGHHRKYRLLDVYRMYTNIPAQLLSIHYDPNRSSFISLIYYLNGVYSFILHINTLNIGDILFNFNNSDQYKLLNVGNSSLIGNFPIGSIIHNIENSPYSGFSYSRAAGSSAMLLKKFRNNQVLIQLKSGLKKLISFNCRAVLGVVSNQEHRFENLGKAGRSRWLGIRPHVRAYAMNPIDHPMGGRTHGGKQLVTPWGKITKGKSTRKRKNKIINL